LAAVASMVGEVLLGWVNSSCGSITEELQREALQREQKHRIERIIEIWRRAYRN